MPNISHHTNEFLGIFVILFLFELAKEGSGMGRWLAKNNEKSIYKEMDKLNLPGSEDAKGPLGGKSSGETSEWNKIEKMFSGLFNLPKNGEPFINNTAVCCFTLISLYLSYVIIRLSCYGYMGKDYFSPGYEGQISWWAFILEIIFIVSINALTQPVGEYIKEGDYSKHGIEESISKSMIFSIIFIIGGLLLHGSLQFVGFIECNRESIMSK
jgi:hypothetical protein